MSKNEICYGRQFTRSMHLTGIKSIDMMHTRAVGPWKIRSMQAYRCGVGCGGRPVYSSALVRKCYHLCIKHKTYIRGMLTGQHTGKIKVLRVNESMQYITRLDQKEVRGRQQILCW
jgi:hypothetical protein